MSVRPPATLIPDPAQQPLDFVRGKRRTWIERMIIPSFERAGGKRRARTAGVKHLLRVIESHARDGGAALLYEKTIAQAMGVSERTVRRHIADCEACGLLTVDRSFYKDRASSHQIQWSAVAQAIVDHPDTAHLIEQPRAQAPGHTTAQAVGIGPFTPDNLSVTPDNLSVTPDNLSELSGVNTLYSRTCILNHHQPHEEPQTKPISRPQKNENEEGLEGEEKNQNKDDADWDELIQTGDYGGWPFRIHAAHLARWRFVQRFWLHASVRGWVYPHERTKFFALAAWAVRQWRASRVRDAGACFSSRVKQAHKTGEWPGNRDDVTAARDAMAALWPRSQRPRDERTELEAAVNKRILADALKSAK